MAVQEEATITNVAMANLIIKIDVQKGLKVIQIKRKIKKFERRDKQNKGSNQSMRGRTFADHQK